MFFKSFYKNYLKFYLNNSEQPSLAKKFYIWFIVITILNIYLSTSPSNLILSVVTGVLNSLIMIIFSFLYGYLALLVNVFFSINGITRVIKLWTITQDQHLIIITGFQIAVLVSSAIIAYLSERERSRQKELERLSIIDGLTEVFNHRYFHQRLKQEIIKAEQNNKHLALIMLDIDNFKKYNDTMGHQAGDSILKNTAKFLKENLTESDILFRYGGDEFAIISTQINSDNIVNRFNEIRKAYSQFSFFKDKEIKLSDKLTISIGISIFPIMADNKNDLIKQADDSLYMAKNTGRNMIQVYRDVLIEAKRFSNIYNEEIVNNMKFLLSTISAKDKYTLGHSERVADYLLIIYDALGISKEIEKYHLAALLHDIGKIEIPEDLLKKRGKLSQEEMNLIKKHPVYSAAILEPLDTVTGIIPIVKHHHERYDGNGYPDGLTAEDIPFGARILSVADAFDAMLSDRPYRKGMTKQEALKELKECSGTQFDPKVVDVFINAISDQNTYS